jgi:alkanesulfonate monooxygenase SsuD/methylene tetrahydromethanopterin reductase-like flavin-dependent oxidoreductase (luciferase family)
MGARFEQLEEAVRICRQMWAGDESKFEGRHFQLERPLNSPQSLSRPHPPILIGGSGEKKTLRLVARYADACNLFAGPNLGEKLSVLRGHCEAEGRDYGTIEKTIAYAFDLGPNGERVEQTIEELAGYAELGIQAVHAGVMPAHDLRQLELVGERIIPAVAGL